MCKLVRDCIYAGSFYTSDAKELLEEIKTYIRKAKTQFVEKDILGVIAPHAGYMYSGPCAANSYVALQQKRNLKRVIIIAPSHSFNDFAFSVGKYDAYNTPFGAIQTDQEIVEQLLADSSFAFHPYAHVQEHSLEVQLPFLYNISNEIKIVPIVFGNQNFENAILLAEKLLPIVHKAIHDTAIIVSTDLSHYHTRSHAKEMDSLLINAIESRDIHKIWKMILSHEVEACGFAGIITLLHIADLMQYDQVQTLNYTDSGYVNYDTEKVVGYLSSVVYKKE